MVCIEPVNVNGNQFPCGKCPTCCYNYRKGWVARLHMESKSWIPEYQQFVTLTYEEVPLTEDYLPTLRKADLQKFFKRCRWAGYTFRYLAVGEYGERGGRPHYHMIVFGQPGAVTQKMLDQHWELGFNLSLPVNEGAMEYVGKYILKSVEAQPKNIAEGKKEPPFKLCSRKPPIGIGGLDELGKAYDKYPLRYHLEKHGDISPVYRTDGRWWSLPYRDANIVREAAGVPTSAELRPAKEVRATTDEERRKAEAYIKRVEAFKSSKATF